MLYILAFVAGLYYAWFVQPTTPVWATKARNWVAAKLGF